MEQWYRPAHSWLSLHWRRVVFIGVPALVVVTIVGQFLYPTNQLLPFSTIDNVALGGWNKADATKKLDSLYQQSTVSVFFKANNMPFVSSHPSDLGVTVSNKARIESMAYPWYLRLIPSSILWAHAVVPVSLPGYARDQKVAAAYIAAHFGTDCHIEPVNATLKADGGTLKVVDASPGGLCRLDEVNASLTTLKPTISGTKVTITGQETQPAVTGAAATTFASQLVSSVGSGVTVTAGSTTVTIGAKDLFSWMDFAVVDGKLAYSFNSDRATAYLDQQFGTAVAVKPGTTVQSTYDFTVVSEVKGSNGSALDESGTLDAIKVAIDSKATKAAAVSRPVAPNITYKRSYSPSDTGLAALMQNFATSHSGTYGISLIELDGSGRHATYNGDTQFTTASTYKLFVAYSSLLRVESGAWSWADQITGGYNLSDCFDRMIKLSDNACGEALLTKVGYQSITNEAHAIGANNTSFLGKDGIKSTASDEALLLALLQKGQILSSQTNRDKLLNDLKGNVYRQGIPAGLKGMTVGDKVGFLDALLHDAAIAYSPTGTYVLVIMTENSSWGNIADLAGQLQSLRTQ